MDNFYEGSANDMANLEGTNAATNHSSSADNMSSHKTTEADTTGSDKLHLPDDGNTLTSLTSFLDEPSTNQNKVVNRVSDVSSIRGGADGAEHDVAAGPVARHDDGNTTSSVFEGRPADTHNVATLDHAFDKSGEGDQTNNGQITMEDSHLEEAKQADKESTEESEFDAIARETALTLDKNLESARSWTKKLLREITLYVKTLEMVRAEYLRIQNLEHKESDRLDQVEPDVQGATSQVLGNFLAASRGHLDSSYDRGNQMNPGSKRTKINHP